MVFVLKQSLDFMQPVMTWLLTFDKIWLLGRQILSDHVTSMVRQNVPPQQSYFVEYDCWRGKLWVWPWNRKKILEMFQVLFMLVKVNLLFLGAPLKINGAPKNIQGNLTSLSAGKWPALNLQTYLNFEWIWTRVADLHSFYFQPTALCLPVVDRRHSRGSTLRMDPTRSVRLLLLSAPVSTKKYPEFSLKRLLL